MILKTMSDLTFAEKQKFEQLLGMGSGYVLEFSIGRSPSFVKDSSVAISTTTATTMASGSKAIGCGVLAEGRQPDGRQTHERHARLSR